MIWEKIFAKGIGAPPKAFRSGAEESLYKTEKNNSEKIMSYGGAPITHNIIYSDKLFFKT